MTNKKRKKLLALFDELGRRELAKRRSKSDGSNKATGKSAAMDSSAKLPSGWIETMNGPVCIKGMIGYIVK